VEVEPDNYFVLHNLTVSLWKRNAFEEALEIERRSVAAHPGKGNEDARYTLGLLYSQLGRPEEAEQAWREALEVAPDHRNSLDSLKRRLFARGDAAGVRRLYEELLERHEELEDEDRRLDRKLRAPFAEPYVELARAHEQANEPSRALALWERAAARGRLPRALVEAGLARSLAALGRTQEAEPHAFRAVREDRSQQEVLDRLSALALRRGEPAARELWERARQAGVPVSVLENGLGRLALELGRWPEAEQRLIRAQELDNTNQDYVVDVCELFFRTGRLDDARRNLEAVLQRNPAHARARELQRRIQAARPP
jgi:tetratricopeptide (TPR) repeat protein